MAIIGPFIESGINPHILNEYDLKVKKAVKNKSVIVLETDFGKYSLKKAKISLTQAERMVKVIEFLNENQFPVTKIIMNKYGERFIPVNGSIVYLSQWIEGKELTLNHNPHMLMSISMLAQLHKIGFFFPQNSAYPYVNEMYIKKSWEDRIDWLKKYYKKLKKKTPITTFEHIYLTYITFLLDWSEEALEHLNQWIIQYNSFDNLRKTICHGKYHHRNVVLTPDNRMYILDFDYVSIDSPVRDLAYFLRHYIVNKEHRTWAQEWLAIYQRDVQFMESETNLLATFLLFPERLISLAKKYEVKQNNINEDEYLKKLQTRWNQMKEIVWFIDQNQWLNKI